MIYFVIHSLLCLLKCSLMIGTPHIPQLSAGGPATNKQCLRWWEANSRFLLDAGSFHW